jgi:hypothetical protein
MVLACKLELFLRVVGHIEYLDAPEVHANWD